MAYFLPASTRVGRHQPKKCSPRHLRRYPTKRIRESTNILFRCDAVPCRSSVFSSLRISLLSPSLSLHPRPFASYIIVISFPFRTNVFYSLRISLLSLSLLEPAFHIPCYHPPSVHTLHLIIHPASSSILNQNTHFMFNNFFPENRTVHEIMSKNMVEPEGATNDVTIWCIRVACWISKATRTRPHARVHAQTHALARTHRAISNIYSFSTALIRERASMLRYTYIACLVVY
jgi:hypothetical protein